MRTLIRMFDTIKVNMKGCFKNEDKFTGIIILQ